MITVWIINNTQNYWESSFVLLWWVKSINTLGDTQWFHKLHSIKVRFAHLSFSTNIFTPSIFKWGCECWISDTLQLRSALRGQNTFTSLFHHMVTKAYSRKATVSAFYEWAPYGLGTCWVITTAAMVPVSHKWASILHLFFSSTTLTEFGAREHSGASLHPSGEQCYCCLVAKLCLTLCNPMDYSPSGSSVYGISQTRILEWVALSFSPSTENKC